MADHEQSSDHRLADWLASLTPLLDQLDGFGPAGFSREFSAASLDVLEDLLATQIPVSVAAGSPVVDTGLVDSAMAYLGETLMRVGGGRWDWDDDPTLVTAGLPIVLFDDALGLPPLSPIRVLVGARKARTGCEFRRVHDHLGAVVRRHQASHPGWIPTKSSPS